MKKRRIFNNNNGKSDNKCYCSRNCCPCKDVGEEHIRKIYERYNLLSDEGDSIVAPEYETTSEKYGLRKGQVYINADSIGKILGDTFADIIKGNIKNVY